MPFFGRARGLNPSPCAGAPTVATCVITQVAGGDCDGADDFIIFRTTVTLSGSLGGEFALQYKVCSSRSSGCSPTDDGAPQAGLTKDKEHNDLALTGGINPANLYVNAEVEVVHTGSSTVCSSLAATEKVEANVRDCLA